MLTDICYYYLRYIYNNKYLLTLTVLTSILYRYTLNNNNKYLLTLTVLTSMLSRYIHRHSCHGPTTPFFLIFCWTVNVNRYLLLLFKVYLDTFEVRTVNVNRYLLLLFKVYLDNIEVRTVSANRYLLLLFKVYLGNIEVRTVNVLYII
jgi:hypothetical protein